MADRRRRRSGSRGRDDYPGWMYGVFGLGIGLSVAAAIWFSDRRAAPPAVAEREPASMERAPDGGIAGGAEGNVDRNGEPGGTVDAPAAEDQAERKKSRFDFYEMLPAFEVVVTEEEEAVVARDAEPQAVVEPGVYVLQAGSFTTYGDADRRRAELALQGIESSIQKVTIDDKTYHRVRIGPTEDLEELNMLRSRLRAAKIDALRIRMGD
ncbi:MAG TPA: SPOR domain-containing protein [Woeseiaceae bacterium]|nr:SPOR domain-containing protein [Woeseiaceae bacterium]